MKCFPRRKRWKNKKSRFTTEVKVIVKTALDIQPATGQRSSNMITRTKDDTLNKEILTVT